MNFITSSKFRYTLTIILSLIITFVHGQTIAGRIVNSFDQSPIESAVISIKGKSNSVYSDVNGAFSIQTDMGAITLLVKYLSVKPIEKAVYVEKAGTVNIGIIPLDLKDKVLQEVVVDGMIKKFSEKKSDYVSRMPLKSLENPQVYTVIPKELLSEQVAVDFRNVMTAAPGVAAATLGVGSGGTGMAMRMRGFAGADGAGSIRNGMATNFVSLSDPANLESIEVIKGPSGTLFGSTLISYGGLVNRVTKKAYNAKSGEIGFTTGAWGLGRITADYNTSLDDEGKALFRINAAYHKENSWQDYGINKTFMVAPTFTFKANDRLTLTMDAEYFNSNRTSKYVNVTSSAITNLNDLNMDWNKSFASNDVTSKAEVLNIFGEAKYILSDKWTSQTLVSYARSDNDANYLFLDVTSKDSLARRFMHIPSIFTTQQVQQNFNGDFKIGSLRNRFLFGLDYTKLTTVDTRAIVNSYDYTGTWTSAIKNIPIQGDAIAIYLDKYNLKMANPSRTTGTRRFTHTYSSYVSDVIDITDRLNLMASIRFDRFNDVQNNYQQNAWSPKLGVVYQILKNKTSVFVNYMDGFANKGPQISDMDGNSSAFKPEHAKQFEGGFKFEFFNRRLSSTISLYKINVSDRIRTVTVDKTAYPTAAVTSYSVQDGTQESKGAEIDVIANPITGMRIILGYGYNENEYTKGGNEGKSDPGTPKHVGNFWISQKLSNGLLSGFGLGFGGNFASKSFLNSSNSVQIDGYSKFDATVFYEKSNFRISAKVNNLTDKHYWLGDYYAEMQAPRQFLANVTFKF